jgi:hypothetical protein
MDAFIQCLRTFAVQDRGAERQGEQTAANLTPDNFQGERRETWRENNMSVAQRMSYAAWELEVLKDEVTNLILKRMAQMDRLKEETLLISEPLPAAEGEAQPLSPTSSSAPFAAGN